MPIIKLFEQWLTTEADQPAAAQIGGIIVDCIDQEIGANGGEGKPFASTSKPTNLITMDGMLNSGGNLDRIKVTVYPIPADPNQQINCFYQEYRVIGERQRTSPNKLVRDGMHEGDKPGLGVEAIGKGLAQSDIKYKNVADCYAMLKGRAARDTWASITPVMWMDLVEKAQAGSTDKLAKAFAENKVGKSTDGGDYQKDYDAAFNAIAAHVKSKATPAGSTAPQPAQPSQPTA